MITGIGGQDGFYLAGFLNNQGYEIVGTTHRSQATRSLRERLPHSRIVVSDVTDPVATAELIEGCEPDEIYNLAGYSFPPDSIAAPQHTLNVNTVGALNVLEAARKRHEAGHSVKVYQASTSEMFGRSQKSPYDERTPLVPETPYAISKVAAHSLVPYYRTHFGLFAVSGIAFNHDSPLRPEKYVTRKVTSAAAEISAGLRQNLALGDLSARRDWGFAGDYVKGMWLMLQQPHPDDYVLATGVLHSVQDLVRLAFAATGIETWQEFVTVDPRLVRPPEKNPPLGRPDKARSTLGWSAEMTFPQLIEMMVAEDVRRVAQRRSER